MSRKPPYSVLAAYYDQLFAPHLKVLAKVRRRLLGRTLRRARSACDLACGPGNTALELAARGMRVYALDASPAMCRIAREKARQRGLEVEVIQADMRSFRLPAPVDVVVCEFDALNHLQRAAELDRVAKAVARALRPGGCFYFDVNTRRAFQEIWPGGWFTETGKVKLAAHGGYDGRRRKGWTELHWFLPEGGLYRHCFERYEQVCWSESRLKKGLRFAGFTEIERWDSAEVIPGVSWFRPGCRFFYLARKADA